MKSVKDYKTKSEKSFDDLVTKKCSWSYKALHVNLENGSPASSPQGSSSVYDNPDYKTHDMSSSNSSKMNGISKEISNQIIKNTNTNISMKLPSSSESIFNELLSEVDKISSQGKVQNKIHKHIDNSEKKKGLRPSKSINYTISSESSSDDEVMVLQIRTFNDTKCVDSNKYNSDHNPNCLDDFNQNSNISNEIIELNDSFTNNEISMEKKGMNAQSFNSEPCSAIPCDKNLKNVKMPSTNNTEMNSDISLTEVDKISSLKKTNKEIYRSDIKQYETQTRTSNGTIWKSDNDKCLSNSSVENSYQTSFPNLSNDEAEINGSFIDTNSDDDFSSENGQNEFAKPSPHPSKDESKNFECELNEMQPQDLYLKNNTKNSQSTCNYFSAKRRSSKKIDSDLLHIESMNSPSELESHINKIPNPESLPINNKISEKYKDLKKPDLQCEIDDIFLNVSSEVQSIGNKTQMSGSLSVDDEITYDFLNGSLDLEKYNLKQYFEKQNCSTPRSKKIRKELESTKVVKRKPLSKSLPLKEKTQLHLKKVLYARKEGDGKTRTQTSKYIALQDDFGQQEKMTHATHSGTSSEINQLKVTRKRTRNSTNHNGQLPEQNQSRKKKSPLEINENSHKERTLLSESPNNYCNSTEDNLFDKSMRKPNLQNDTRKGKSPTFQNISFEENNIYSQSSCSSNSISKNIQPHEKTVNQLGKNNIKDATSRLDYNTNEHTKENSNRNRKKMYILSSEDDAENKIKSAHLIKKTTKEDLLTWEDLETLLLSNTTQFDHDKKLSLKETKGKGQRTSMNRKRDSCSSSSSSAQNILGERSDTLDIIEPIPSRYSFNRNKPEKLMFSENLENEMSSLVPKSSTNMSIIEKTIANMSSYASPYLRPRNDKSQPVRMESSDESNEDNSPILTEYSYAIQEFKSTIYFTADKEVNTGKETCFASKIEEKGTLHKKEAKFSNTINKNYKYCMQNKSLGAVVNSRKIASTSHPVSSKPISRWSTPNSSSYKMNKEVTSVRQKQTNILIPEIKMASNKFTIESNKNKTTTGEKRVEKDLNEDVFNMPVSINEDTDSSTESTDFRFRDKIDEKKKYNLRKRKSHKDNKETNKSKKNTKRIKSVGTNLQFYNSGNAPNLKTKQIELLSENSTGSESHKNLNTLKQRKRKYNTVLKDQFTLSHENCGKKEINYPKCVSNTSNLLSSKENEQSGSEMEPNQIEKMSNIRSFKKDACGEEDNTYKGNENAKKNEDLFILNGNITSNSKILPKRNSTGGNTGSEFIKEMKNGSSNPSKSSKENIQNYDECETYLKGIFQDEDTSIRSLQNSQFGDAENPKKGSDLKQKFSKTSKDQVLHIEEMSDVFSISSFDSNSDENEVSQKQGTGFLFDLLAD